MLGTEARAFYRWPGASRVGYLEGECGGMVLGTMNAILCHTMSSVIVHAHAESTCVAAALSLAHPVIVDDRPDFPSVDSPASG